METTGTDPAPTPAPVTYPTQELRFIFRGSGGEYFRIWIVNLALTLLTLGIYGAWAKVRRLRYFYGNTEIAGSSFEYHGQPVQILKGRIIALVLILPYYLLQRSYPFWSLAFLLLFLAALPFIIVKSRRFQLHMTSWRNIRFGFDGRYGQAARLYLLVPMLIPLTLGLIIPYITYLRQRFLVAQTRFGATRLEFNARGGAYYRIYGLALLVVIGIFVLVGILSVGLMGPVKALFAAAAPGGAGVDRPLLFLVIAVAYLTVIALLMVPYAMVKAGTTNQALGLATLGPHSVHSRLASGKLAWIYVSNLVLTILTLGLFAPWASVRAVKYQLDNTSLTAVGDLDQFVATEEAQTSAVGEEVGDLLDIDFGL